MASLLSLAIALALAVPALANASDFTYSRRYKVGEKFGYKYQRTQKNAGQPDSVVNGRTRHEVKMVDLTPGEMVNWVSIIETSPAGLRDRTAEVSGLPPFLLALPPVGRHAFLEKIPYPAIDFTLEIIRFYQALETTFFGTFLKKSGDRYVYPQPVRRLNGGAGATPPWPQYAACFERSIELVNWQPAEKKAKLRIRDAPPLSCPGFRLPAPFMATATTAPTTAPNNIGTISMQNGRYDLNWGTEENTLELELDMETGLILRGREEMVSRFTSRAGCDANYQNCQGMVVVGQTPPVREFRRITEINLLR